MYVHVEVTEIEIIPYVDHLGCKCMCMWQWQAEKGMFHPKVWMEHLKGKEKGIQLKTTKLPGY